MLRRRVPGANLVLNKSVFPLTPRFSAVKVIPNPPNRFNGFFAAITIKPASRSNGCVPRFGRFTR